MRAPSPITAARDVGRAAADSIAPGTRAKEIPFRLKARLRIALKRNASESELVIAERTFRRHRAAALQKMIEGAD